MLSELEKPLKGLRVGVLGKGGSGKSTVTVLLARSLRQHGYDVVVLDADSTNVGLPAALGIDHAPASLIDYYGGMVFSGGRVTCPVDDPTPLAGADVTLSELEPDFVARSPDGIVLLIAGKMGHKGPGAGCDGPIGKIVRDIRIHSGRLRPVTLVDFKAGFEDSARGVILGLDWVVVVVDPTPAGIQMAIDLSSMVEQIRSGGLPATSHLDDVNLIELARNLYRQSRIGGVLGVLNRTHDEGTEFRLKSALSRAGIDLIGVIPSTPALTTAWLDGDPLDPSWVRVEMQQVVAGLEMAGTRQVGAA